MKKILLSGIVLILAVSMLAACAAPLTSDAGGSAAGAAFASAEEKAMLKKLRRIRSDWTEQQVRDLLGTPDRFGEMNVVGEVFYMISPTKEATIAFWSEGIEITVTDAETGEKAVILGAAE